jgi:hypothetical protein
MGEQRHVIKRQVLEVALPPSADVQRCQAELSRAFRQQIVPLLDSYCSQLSTPDRVYRIDKLQLDLGVIDGAELEESFVAKVRQTLFPTLAEQIRALEQRDRQQGIDSEIRSQLEVVAYFAEHGTLPWWADGARPRLWTDALHWLLDQAPVRLAALLRRLLPEPRPLQRIIQHTPDALLGQLAGLLMPAEQSFFDQTPGEWIAFLQSLEPGERGEQPGHTPPLRQSVWRALLRSAAQGEGVSLTPQHFARSVLTEVAAAGALPEGELLASIARQQQAGKRIPLALQQRGEPSTPPAAETGELWGALQRIAQQLPAAPRQELLATLAAWQQAQPRTPNRLVDAVRPLLDKVRPELAQNQWAAIDRLLAAVRPLAARGQPPAPAAARRTGDSDESALDLTFSSSGDAYIGNAGLVILWPFLDHFFAHLGLVDSRRFTGIAAQQRAAGLLHYLAAVDLPQDHLSSDGLSQDTLAQDNLSPDNQSPDDLSPPDYLLPLNKVLCGLDVAEVFDFGKPLSAHERAACSDLLQAVITQAPILRSMSTVGFQRTFLRRAGRLSTRDGAWLLQAERETYDVVLDRFPWGWQWVKLPWMDAPLRVEW